MLNGLFKIAVAQGPQTTAATVARRTRAAEHDLASAAGRDAAVTGIGPKRHPDVTYRLRGTAYAAGGQRSGCG